MSRRVLAIDHFFGQDLAALEASAPAGVTLVRTPYEPFLRLATEHFGDEVLTGIDAFFDDRHAAARARYAEAAGRRFDALLQRLRFDAVLAPSDTFFWIRALVERAQALGIPFAVLQKEATIPPGWLDGPAQEWGATSPFIADFMLVSSEHHKRFWVNAATDPQIIAVTGQPRFDVYRGAGAPPAWAGLGVDVGDRPAVLFLTYDVNAYLPVIDRTGLAPWQRLRDETEATLVELARSGRATVLVKAHPQPAEDQTAHLAELAREPGVIVLDPLGDVRDYLLACDAVVGFQSTALFEALAAGKPVVYTWWTDAVAGMGADLIPFHEHGDALTVARAPAELRAALDAALAGAAAPPASQRLVEEYMGPIGGAGARCWTHLLALIASASAVGERRAQLLARTPAQRARAQVRAAAELTGWRAAAAAPAAVHGLLRLAGRLRGRPVPTVAAVTRELDARRRSAAAAWLAARD